MKLTRRQIVVAAAGSVAVAKALAQSSPAPDLARAGGDLARAEGDLAKTARDSVQRNADTLAKFSIPMSTEPAFQFKP